MFGKTKINSPIYYPLLASEEINGGAVSKIEAQEIWSRFDLLSENEKALLTDEEMPKKIKELQDKLGCDDASIESVSVLLRWFFFKEVDEQGLYISLQEIVAEKADQALKFIQKEILTIKPKVKVEEVSEEEKKQVAVTVKLPLLQALSKYEQLGNQLITRERIKIKSQSEPVRPSLLYWIKYYRDELGVGHHDSVQRGNFLFRSENGKRLSPEERERVNLVLKSVEENFPLEIDTEQGLVLFPTFVAPQAPRPVPQAAAPSRMAPLQNSASFHFGTTTMNAPKTAAPEQSGTLSFSSKHVLPAEKAQAIPQERTAPEPQNMPQRMAPRAPMPKANPFHIRPVSLGKEE